MILLPVLGMIFLLILNLASYMNGALFMDKLLVCSFILTFVFVIRIREILSRPVPKVKTKKIKRPNYGTQHPPLARRAL